MARKDTLPSLFGSRSTAKGEHSVLSLQDEMNRLFDSFFTGFPTISRKGPLSGTESFRPDIDIVDKEQEILVSAELPGLESGDVDITLHDNSLVIQGEKRVEEEHDDKDRGHYVERSYGSFRRVIPLHAEVDEDGVKASFKKGVLKIRLPKTVEAKERSRKISVEH